MTRPSLAVADALTVVDATADDVLRAIAVDTGEPYLVGSLAVGLGDRRSDVDVHVVTPLATPDEGPTLAFTTTGLCIDIRCISPRTIERVLRADRDCSASPIAGRTDAWLASRWLNALPFNDAAPPLLDDELRARARSVVLGTLLTDLVALASFTRLAEAAHRERSWYLARRAGVAAWELAAALSGHDHLGERWLPARSLDPRVASLGVAAATAETYADVAALLDLLALAPDDLGARVRLAASPETERWTVANESWLLVAGRRLVPRLDIVPTTIDEAVEGDAATAFEGLVARTLRWSVDTTGLAPALGGGR